jgi:hypothetical protein
MEMTMKYLLIPNSTTSREAILWIGAFEDPGNRKIEILSHVHPSPFIGKWQRWPAKNAPAKLYYQRLSLSGLEPGDTYLIRLAVDEKIEAECTIKTLPKRLPESDQEPFKVLLGSCFSVGNDGEGRVGKSFFNLPAGAHPDIKILSGDQVYLDSPWHYYLIHTHNQPQLQAKLFDHYFQTWTQAPLGFHYLLKKGANFFSSDDHELWNNAPNFTPYVRDSWTNRGRKRWLDIAKSLYDVFQTPSTITRFNVAPLSFMIADTRLNRDAHKKRFMTDADLTTVADWIDNVKGIGVLVFGQPVFGNKKGPLGHISDWSLPDFEQYRDLVRILMGSKKSLIILTGDVHFGRIAWTALPSGATLFEIISSPLELIHKTARGNWKPAPSRFPAESIKGLPSCTVYTYEKFTATYGHFLTIEFSQIAGGVEIAIKVWRVDGQPNRPEPIFQKKLYDQEG